MRRHSHLKAFPTCHLFSIKRTCAISPFMFHCSRELGAICDVVLRDPQGRVRGSYGWCCFWWRSRASERVGGAYVAFGAGILFEPHGSDHPSLNLSSPPWAGHQHRDCFVGRQAAALTMPGTPSRTSSWGDRGPMAYTSLDSFSDMWTLNFVNVKWTYCRPPTSIH